MALTSPHHCLETVKRFPNPSAETCIRYHMLCLTLSIASSRFNGFIFLLLPYSSRQIFTKTTYVCTRLWVEIDLLFYQNIGPNKKSKHVFL